MARYAVVLMLLCLGCRTRPYDLPAVDAGPPMVDAAPPTVDAAACLVDRIKFTQLDGCANDGSVELCVPNNDPSLIDQLTTIAPGLTCIAGQGRARCSTAELLCFDPTTFPNQCITDHGALTDDAWRAICNIAALLQPGHLIVPTIFE